MKSKILKLACILAVAFPWQLQAQFLHTNGTQIVDGLNQEVIWRGIGFGGWMLQESYMLGTSGSQHVIESRIDDLVGVTRRKEFDTIPDEVNNDKITFLLLKAENGLSKKSKYATISGTRTFKISR